MRPGGAKTFRLRLEAPHRRLAGQHYVVRLTAPDGYTASRSYSIASAPDDTAEIEITVERLEGGEVSAFLHEVLELGDELEVRGPLGGWFVWDGHTPAPAELAYVCGSSGFADAASALLIDSGMPAGAIRVERFGPSSPLRGPVGPGGTP
ncbi:MAG TPA: FAD-binding oxidoreductase [Acidimicrobiales bacterium]|nr:FAD-binding oxidoreductase [Acidimicrobiales bacterium]